MKKIFVIGRDGKPTNTFQYATEPEDEAYIISNYGKITAKVMAKKFGMSCASMMKILNQLIPERMHRIKPWSCEDDKMLMRMYPTKSTKTISEIMNRSERSIDNRAKYLGIEKSEDKKDVEPSRNLRTCCGRFCYKRTECLHYCNWLRLGKPENGQINRGYTTECIQYELYKDFIPEYDNKK